MVASMYRPDLQRRDHQWKVTATGSGSGSQRHLRGTILVLSGSGGRARSSRTDRLPSLVSLRDGSKHAAEQNLMGRLLSRP